MTICMRTASPRLTEYGRFNDMKNFLKTLNTVLSSVMPSPHSLLVANPVKYHEVIVSGAISLRVMLPELNQFQIFYY